MHVLSKLFLMQWIHHYQLFLFDFDGILVNTEELHYKAYLKMCAGRGFSLKWDMRTYMQYAMYTSTGVKEAVYQEFPELYTIEPNWDVLYKEKRKAYFDLLQKEGTSLMPGVKELLQELKASNLKRCVVTHSPSDQIALIRQQHPVLNTIPNWITREHYSQPKPSSECYLKAIALYKTQGDRVIGFEDSPRGLQALLGTEAKGVLISDCFDTEEITRLSQALGREFAHYSTFKKIEEPGPEGFGVLHHQGRGSNRKLA